VLRPFFTLHGVSPGRHASDPVCTPGTTFETVPFPDGLTPNIPTASYATDPRAVAIAIAARARVNARDRWLNPPELVGRVPEVVPGLPDRLVPKDADAAVSHPQGRALTGLYNTPSDRISPNLRRA
jgi:hypothetical protein